MYGGEHFRKCFFERPRSRVCVWFCVCFLCQHPTGKMCRFCPRDENFLQAVSYAVSNSFIYLNPSRTKSYKLTFYHQLHSSSTFHSKIGHSLRWFHSYRRDGFVAVGAIVSSWPSRPLRSSRLSFALVDHRS